jgi:hypothetical protein
LLPGSPAQQVPPHLDQHVADFLSSLCASDQGLQISAPMGPVLGRADQHEEADLHALIDARRGDVPLVHLRFRCSNYGSSLMDFVVTATEATGQPR